MFNYDVYGVTLKSEIKLALPEGPRETWNEAVSSPSNAVVRIVAAEADDFAMAPEHLASPSEDWIHHSVLESGALYLRWRDWFEFVVAADGSSVACRNLSCTPLESFEAYLVNFAVTAALIQQGEEPLHATVVEIGGRGIGLLGSSGAGKSTLAAFLTGKGADVVTDDMLRITFRGQTAIAHPGPYRLKLFPDPASRFLPDAQSRGRWSPLGKKLIYDLGEVRRHRAPCRLSALYHLCLPAGPRNDEIKLEKLAGTDSFRTILASTMNARLHTPSRLERQFRFAERVASVLPVCRLSYPRRFDAFAEVADMIDGSAPK
ncbi:MAG: hypothetical protein ACLP7P_02830 [Rhodomicrobium sp.]